MNIFADENIPAITVRTLRQMGHDVSDIRYTPAQGMEDENIWRIVRQEKRLLITTDKGFSQYRNEPHGGILIVRLKQPNRLKIHQRILQAMAARQSEKEWSGIMVVMRDFIQSIYRFESVK
ncbi:MAG TPA: hypothetical protein DCQ37_21970 [Desulfobacteraceae bacterium]|nr:hypothetical protein [Desulfobacteraceae bacterium]